MTRTLFAILLSLILVGCASNSFYSWYLDQQREDGGAHRYFVMAETIDGQEALIRRSNTRVYLKDFKIECEKRFGKTCEVTYEDNNYIGKIVQQQDRRAEPQIGFGEAFMKGWREAGEKQEEENRIEKERKLKAEQDKKLAYINTLKNHCRAFGFSEGTDALASCVMNQDRLVQQQKAKEEADAGAAFSNAMNAIANYRSPEQKMQEQQQQNYNIQMNCRTIRAGNILQTKCD